MRCAASRINVCGIAAKRRNKSNPWFKRGTLFRSAVDVMRRAHAPMTAREIAEALIAGKAVPATRKQFKDLQAAILAALRKRDGAMVLGLGTPARWSLRASPSVSRACPKPDRQLQVMAVNCPIWD